MTVYAAIAGLLALMGGFVFYASLDKPFLQQAKIELQSVEVINVNTVDNLAELQISFLIKNPSEKTFTVPIINFELFANGEHIGTGQYSTVDIAMPGRVTFLPGDEKPLKSTLSIALSDVKSDIYQAIIEEKNIEFRAEGIITIETALSSIDKEFQASL